MTRLLAVPTVPARAGLADRGTTSCAAPIGGIAVVVPGAHLLYRATTAMTMRRRRP